jgi:tRNA G18 (ribose-2'-O)-methylase SpoU
MVAVAHTTPIDATPEEVRALLSPLRSGVTLVLYTFGNAFSIGACVRVAHSFLCRDIVLVGDEPHYEKASMGMEKYEDIARVQTDDELFARIGARPLWAVEKDHATTSLYGTLPFPDDVVLALGSERHGLPDSVLARATQVVGIPMYGINHSFPVAIACGMVLGEWARRRYANGVTL